MGHVNVISTMLFYSVLKIFIEPNCSRNFHFICFHFFYKKSGHNNNTISSTNIKSALYFMSFYVTRVSCRPTYEMNLIKFSIFVI